MVENAFLLGNAAVLLVTGGARVIKVCISQFGFELSGELNHLYFCCIALCPLGCLNGGFCVKPGICQCLPGYFGIRCQEGQCTKR